MQDRYAGDVGDFGKLALLRALSRGRRLCVGWYLCTGEGERNNDGAHIRYLEQPERFRALEPEVFDALSELVRGPRSVAALEKTGLIAAAAWHRTPVPKGPGRDAWFEQLVRAAHGCDLVFADPDNGIADEPTPKHISLAEIHALRRRGRALLVYHHQTRMKGGAQAEASALKRQLGVARVDVIRMKSYASRFYFLLDADAALRTRLNAFAQTWQQEAELIA